MKAPGTMRQDLYAELYEVENTHWWHAHKRAVAHEWIKRFARVGRVLDVGAGTGRMLAELRQRGWAVAGVDGEREAAGWCLRRGVTIAVVDLATGGLPFADSQFNLVLALDLLEHLDDDTAVLQELARVTRPEGIILLSVPAYPRLYSYWDEMLGHRRRYTVGQIQALLTAAGLNEQRTSYFFSFALLPAVVVRWGKARAGWDKQGVSDFQVRPLDRVANPVLRVLSSLERLVLRHFRLPFGLSILAVARKR